MDLIKKMKTDVKERRGVRRLAMAESRPTNTTPLYLYMEARIDFGPFYFRKFL